MATVISISKPTPEWATWVFRIVFLLTTALSIWLGGTHLILDAGKVEIMVALKSLDVVIWGLGKALGVQKPDIPADNT